MRLAANGTPGDNVRATIRRTKDGYVWNGSAVVPFVVGDIASYGLTATDPDGVGDFSLKTEIAAPGLPDESYYISFFAIANVGLGLQQTDAPAFASKNFVLGPAAPDPGATVTGDNMAAYTQRLAQIDVAIANLLASPRPNYSVNGVKMDFGDLLEKMNEFRATIIARMNSIPAEGSDAFQDDVSIFGEDLTHYQGNLL